MESRANVLLTNVFGHTQITVSLDDENVYDAIKFRSSFMVKITSPEEVFNRHADDLVLHYPDYHREAGEQPLPGKRRRKRSRSPQASGENDRDLLPVFGTMKNPEKKNPRQPTAIPKKIRQTPSPEQERIEERTIKPHQFQLQVLGWSDKMQGALQDQYENQLR